MSTELAAIIDKALCEVTGIFDTTDAENAELADEILKAGYRKPRTIFTAEQLDALPTGTIVQDAFAVACQRTDKWLEHKWERIGQVHPHRPYIPVDVLWEPQP